MSLMRRQLMIIILERTPCGGGVGSDKFMLSFGMSLENGRR